MSFREATQFASCSISGYLNLDTLNQRRDVISMTGYIGSISSQLEEGSVTEIADLFGENNQDALPQWFIINREGDLVSEVGVLEV